MALVTMVANAQLTMVNIEETPLLPTDLSQFPVYSRMLYKVPAKVTPATGDDFIGQYIEDDFVNAKVQENSYNQDVAVDIVKNEDGTYTLKKFGGYGDATATYNEETGALDLTPGQSVYTHPTYGETVLTKMIIEDGKLKISTGGISLVMDEDGILSVVEAGWILTIKEGEYAGFTLGNPKLNGCFRKVNGTMKAYEMFVKADVTYPVAAYEDEAGIHIAGFCGMTTVTVADGKMADGQDVIYYNDTQGMFRTRCVVVDGSNIETTDNGTNVTMDADGALYFSSFALSNNKGVAYWLYLNTVVELEAGTLGISEVAVAPHSDKIYNLQGMEVPNSSRPGIYIHHGHRYIVK